MDFVKGVAIMMVVLYHTMLFLRSIEYEGGGMGRAKIVLELFPMPAFFLIAGMFHFRVVRWSFADTWKRRLSGYLYLYIVWSVIRFAFYLIVPNVRSTDGGGASATDPLALLGILVWPISSYWFIYALFVFTLLVWLGRKLPSWAQLTATAVISILFSTGLVDTYNVGWDRMGEYLVFFVAGVLLSHQLAVIVHKAKPWHVVALFVAFLAIAVPLAFIPIANRIPGVVLLGQVVSVAFGCAAAVYLVRVRQLSWVSYIGARSLNIYLLHVFVIAGLVALVQAMPWLRVLPGRGFLVLFTVATLVVIICLLASKVLTRMKWLFVNPVRTRRRRKNRARPPTSSPGPHPKAADCAPESVPSSPDSGDRVAPRRSS